MRARGPRSAVVFTLLLAGLAASFSSGGASAQEPSSPGGAPAEIATRTDTGFIVAIAAIDPDALVRVQTLLACLGHYSGPLDGRPRPELDLALRAFATSRGQDPPSEEGWVSARTLDALGAGYDVALRWGATGPRAPELSSEEMLSLNEALFARGYRTSLPVNAVDADTVAAIRSLQLVTGHPVQRGELIERRWLFILGVAGEEPPRDVLPAGFPR